MMGTLGIRKATLAVSATACAVMAQCAFAMAGDAKVLIEEGAAWSYYTGSSFLPGGWASDPFPHLTTGEGVAPLGFNYDDIATVIPFGPDERNKYAAAYFARYFKWKEKWSGDGQFGATLKLSCDDGCIAYVNGVEVARLRLPDGKVEPHTAAPVNKDTAFNNYDIPRSIFKPGKNIIAVELHQQSAWSSDFRFNAVMSAGADN